MPYKSEKIKLRPEQDRRRKLTEEQKQEIRERYARGDIGLRPLGKEYGVSKSLINIIVNPDRAEYNRQYIKNHWKEHRQSKEERTAATRNTRRYKQELYLKGELK